MQQLNHHHDSYGNGVLAGGGPIAQALFSPLARSSSQAQAGGASSSSSGGGGGGGGGGVGREAAGT